MTGELRAHSDPRENGEAEHVYKEDQESCECNTRRIKDIALQIKQFAQNI